MGSHRSTYGGNVSIWTSPEVDPVTGIQVQVVFLGSDTRKHQQGGARNWDKEGRKPINFVLGVFYGCHNELSQT